MMILLDAILHNAINPALGMLPANMDTDAARVMLLSIGLQESRFEARAQKVHGKPYAKGPARGFWQFEQGGGVNGVMAHPASKRLAIEVCKKRDCPWDVGVVHARLEFDDILAGAFARLLLFTDPKPLPDVDSDHEAAWQYYFRNWRPGKPHRETWDEFHKQARQQVMS